MWNTLGNRWVAFDECTDTCRHINVTNNAQSPGKNITYTRDIWCWSYKLLQGCVKPQCQLKYCDYSLFYTALTVVYLRSRRWVFSLVTSPCSPLWWTLWKRPESSLNKTSKKLSNSMLHSSSHSLKEWNVKGKKKIFLPVQAKVMVW